MPRFFVELPDRHFDVLGHVAQEDCRAPRDEASYLLREALQKRASELGRLTRMPESHLESANV
jgi:hypothetical protein